MEEHGAFNDIETMNNKMTAGVLNLEIGDVDGAQASINISKLVPGDTITRSFTIKNNGNVDIENVFLSTAAIFTQGIGADRNPGNNSRDDFLKQFQINVYKADGTNLLSKITPSTTNAAVTGKYVSLYDFVEATKTAGVFNITTGNGLPNTPASDPNSGDFDGVDFDTITMELTFVNDLTKVPSTNNSQTALEYLQNKYMGNSVKLDFTFEATQKTGGPRVND